MTLLPSARNIVFLMAARNISNMTDSLRTDLRDNFRWPAVGLFLYSCSSLDGFYSNSSGLVRLTASSLVWQSHHVATLWAKFIVNYCVCSLNCCNHQRAIMSLFDQPIVKWLLPVANIDAWNKHDTSYASDSVKTACNRFRNWLLLKKGLQSSVQWYSVCMSLDQSKHSVSLRV